MSKKEIVILGAGLAGLSAAWHLQKKCRSCSVFEKEEEVGGLCRSKVVNGYTFDYTGHLLHFRKQYTLDLVKRLLGDNLRLHNKSAWVYSHDRFTRFPFQANLFGLPEAVVKECLLGLIRARSDGQLNKKNPTFLEWIHHTFGEGIARHFMVPYNHKFWTVSPQKLNCEWFNNFIPVPSLGDTIQGTIAESRKSFGYNAVFWYPKRGGINLLPTKLAAGIRNIHLNHKVANLDIKNKLIHFTGGGSKKYDQLIYTLPLPEMNRLANPLPSGISASLKRLRYNSIFNINLGISKLGSPSKHWVYFPQKEFVFYRLGFPGSFSNRLLPKNTNSLYIEISYSKKKPLDKSGLMKQVLKNLTSLGLITSVKDIAVQDTNDIKYGYIIYDRNRAAALKRIVDFLGEKDIHCLGRYGSWRYLSMEDCLLEGKRISNAL